jgi:hypothetical protein
VLISSDGWANIREKKSAMMIAGMRSGSCFGEGDGATTYSALWLVAATGTNILLRPVP